MTKASGSPRPHLEHSPLILTLSEIRFAPVLAMEQNVPAVQDVLRKNGFPEFAVAQQQQIQFGPDGPLLLEPTKRWIFTSADGMRAITLTPASIAIQVRDYSTFENFLESVGTAISAIEEHVNPIWASRVGVRYVDAIMNVGTDLSGTFSEQVRTFTPQDLGVVSLLSSQQIVARTSSGQLTIRMNQVENAPVLPADLMSGEFMELSESVEGLHAILDIDASSDSRSAFNMKALTSRLWEVHEPASAGFWRSVTEEAKLKWGLSYASGQD